ncbi:MFS transporter [Hymenobacter caeli]|uniref:MFS family permease n=1 Tax=Hymenobacter caeli TaxID=2735894 RepID=A0ABX2FNW3_9BACT|nr:MFS transporter [Hymenobacter caeli]NRT18543.1 MFS family permease [Hymenobacter caeli]
MISAFRSLAHRNFRLYYAGQSVSLIGTWMQRLAVGWLVYSQTHSALLLGLVSFAGQIPTLLLAPYGGTVADRYSRYRVLLITQVASLVQASVLAWLVLSGHYATWAVAGLSLLLGTINAFDIPARQSLIVELVDDRAHLPNAIALNSTMVNLARLVGPALAGLLLARYGEGPCFVVNAVSFVAVVASLLLMRIAPRPVRTHRPGALEGLREGWAYLRQAPALRRQILLMAGISFCAMPFGTLLPVFAKDVFHGQAGTYGWLNSLSGLGALTGAFYLASQPAEARRPQLITYAALGFCASLVGFALSPQLGPALLFITLGGTGMMLFIAGTNTAIQTNVADHMRGRVLSYYVMAFQGVQPLGSLLVGWLARHLGAPHTVLLQGAAGLAVGLAFWWTGRPATAAPAPRPAVPAAHP